MTRQEALRQFETFGEKLLENYQVVFWEKLSEYKEELGKNVLGGLNNLANEIKKAGKEEIVHFQFSLLRVDLLARKYNVLLSAYDVSWYLDDTAVWTTFDISFLFEDLNTLWDQLLAESKKYVGKINHYDVDSMIVSQILNANKLIAHSVRFILRDIEEKEFFQDISKADFFVIRWGEYRDQSEIILQVDRSLKTEKDWEKALDEVNEVEDHLVCSYWYKGKFNQGELIEKQLYFSGFEKCKLENINFTKAALLGARFKECKLKNCNFTGALLKYSDFRKSDLQNVCFEDADLTGAMFSDIAVPYLHLSPSQLQTIYIERN